MIEDLYLKELRSQASSCIKLTLSSKEVLWLLNEIELLKAALKERSETSQWPYGPKA